MSDKSTQGERDEVLKLLEPLFEEAERTDKWFKFVNAPNDALITFTPLELRTLHKLGQMIYGPVHWVLIAPVGGKK